MIALFLLLLLLAALCELVKGLSANGTPPVLQTYAWQMDLAHFMWSHIAWMRAVFGAALLIVGWFAVAQGALVSGLGLVLIGGAWAGIYWVFNHYWVGRVKFLPIRVKAFAGAAQNAVPLSHQVMGVAHGGVQVAYPVEMIFYHHQITDTVGGQPIWVTYCGLCRSGRIYDIQIDGRALDFALVGAINYNAVFTDTQTGSWWRQEMGDAAKGPYAGRQLADISFEQMRLDTWLTKYPDSQVLQYDPAFAPKYTFLAKLLSYEASLPGWHRQETPPLIIGVAQDGQAQAYDFEQLKKRRLVNDTLAQTPLLILSDQASAFVYHRTVSGTALDFALNDAGHIIDTQTGSTWDLFGRCTSGAYAGQALAQVQSYQQFLRAWVTFRPATTFFAF